MTFDMPPEKRTLANDLKKRLQFYAIFIFIYTILILIEIKTGIVAAWLKANFGDFRPFKVFPDPPANATFVKRT